MRKTEIEKYRKALLELKSRLDGTVRGMQKEALETDDEVPSVDSLADHGTGYFDLDLTLSIVEDKQETIQAIDEALERNKDGTYGRCESCNKVIPKKRLNAIPHARLCLECQELEEQNVT